MDCFFNYSKDSGRIIATAFIATAFIAKDRGVFMGCLNNHANARFKRRLLSIAILSAYASFHTSTLSADAPLITQEQLLASELAHSSITQASIAHTSTTPAASSGQVYRPTLIDEIVNNNFAPSDYQMPNMSQYQSPLHYDSDFNRPGFNSQGYKNPGQNSEQTSGYVQGFYGAPTHFEFNQSDQPNLLSSNGDMSWNIHISLSENISTATVSYTHLTLPTIYSV